MMRRYSKKLQKKHSLEYPILVKKGNALIHAIGHPNIMATRMLLFALTKIRMRDGNEMLDDALYERVSRYSGGVNFKEGLVAVFSEQEFKQYLPGRNGSFKNTVLSLFNISSPVDLIHNWVVNIPSHDGTYLAGAVCVITATYYDEESGLFFIKFNDEDIVKRELYSITEQYSLLDLRQEMRFHSAYSARLYELLLSEVGLDNARNHVRAQGTYTFHFGLKRLEYILGTCYIKEGTSNTVASHMQAMFIGARTDADFDRIFDQYKDYLKSYRFNDLWRNVLEIALREINENDKIPYRIEATPEKTGRSVTSIIFTVTATAAPVTIENEALNSLIEAIDDTSNEVLQWLDKNDVYGLTEAQKQNLIKVSGGDIERIKKAYEVASSCPPDNPAAFLTCAIRDNYEVTPVAPHKKEKKAPYIMGVQPRVPEEKSTDPLIERLKEVDFDYLQLTQDEIWAFASQKHMYCLKYDIHNASLPEIIAKIKESCS